MKKKISAALLLSGVAVKSQAQDLFGDSIQNIVGQIETIFPWVAGAIFIVGVLFNLGKFFGEDRDIKKGITNILIYVVVLLSITGIYAFIKSISL